MFALISSMFIQISYTMNEVTNKENELREKKHNMLYVKQLQKTLQACIAQAKNQDEKNDCRGSYELMPQLIKAFEVS